MNGVQAMAQSNGASIAVFLFAALGLVLFAALGLVLFAVKVLVLLVGITVAVIRLTPLH